MRNIKPKGLILLLVILFLGMSSIIVYADSMSVKMSINSAKLQEDTTYTLTANMENIISTNGIETIVAKFEYDASVFDKNSINIATINGWSPLYDEETGLIIMQKGTKNKQDEIFLTIHLKTKSQLKTNSTEILLNDITASGGSIEDGGTGDLELGNLRLTLNKNYEAPQSNAESDINFEISTTTSSEQTEDTKNTSNNTANNSTNSTNINSSASNNSQVAQNEDKTNNNAGMTTKNNQNNLTAKELISNGMVQDKNGTKGTNVILIIIIIIAVVAIIGYLVYIKLKGNKIYK